MSWRDAFRMKTGSGLKRKEEFCLSRLQERKEAFQMKRILKRKILIAVSIRPLVLMLVHAREELSFNNRSLNEHWGAIEAHETKLGMIFAEFD